MLVNELHSIIAEQVFKVVAGFPMARPDREEVEKPVGQRPGSVGVRDIHFESLLKRTVGCPAEVPLAVVAGAVARRSQRFGKRGVF